MTDTDALSRSLGRIEGKQDLLLFHIDGLTKAHESLKNEVAGIDKRVSKVENRVTYWAGGLAVITALVVYFRDKITGVFS